MLSKTTVALLFLLVTFSTSMVIVQPEVLAKSHGAFCKICEDLVNDGEALGDEALDAWLDKEIEPRCEETLSGLRAYCIRDLKQVEKDIQQAIANDIPGDKICKDVDLC